MRTLKRTYTLPAETIREFERSVSTGERSAAITRLLNEWLEARKREALRREIVEGCREMADVYLEIEKEFHPLEEEVDRGFDAEPSSRRGGARSSRPRRRVRTGR